MVKGDRLTSFPSSSAPTAHRPPNHPAGREREWTPQSLPSLSPVGLDDQFPDLPEWFSGFRDHQRDAICEVVDAYKRGADVVFLDGPTGSGKTLVGEAVRQVIGGKAMYVCHSLGLQDQFVSDFPYARVLKGSTNYPTELMSYPEYTGGDCTPECQWCTGPESCPYKIAKRAAQASDLAVLNTAYFLNTINHTDNFAGRRLVILDEADTIESLVMGFEEFRLSGRFLRKLGLTAPNKGVHRQTVGKFLVDQVEPRVKKMVSVMRRELNAGSLDVEGFRTLQQLEQLHRRARVVAAKYKAGTWVRCYDHTGAFILKPISVADVSPNRLWQHSRLWLLMSATLVSTQEIISSLGMSGLKVETVTMPMTFPVEHRPLYAVPIEKVTAKTKEVAYPRIARAIEKVLDRHPNDRVLVHTVNYEFASYLQRHVNTDRQKLTYQNAGEREPILEEFRRRMAAVLFAPSLDRGFDFRDDDARVVIVAKLPYPYLGDQQISARMNTPDGQYWYTIQTIRSLVQMTGRGVRSKEDWAHTYILDAGFMDFLRRNRHLLPEWWLDALRTDVVERTL
jgi:Rad3-related DNA helicase